MNEETIQDNKGSSLYETKKVRIKLKEPTRIMMKPHYETSKSFQHQQRYGE